MSYFGHPDSARTMEVRCGVDRRPAGQDGRCEDGANRGRGESRNTGRTCREDVGDGSQSRRGRWGVDEVVPSCVRSKGSEWDPWSEAGKRERNGGSREERTCIVVSGTHW